MKLHAIRSLRGQLLATGSLFVVCVPVAMIVIWQRPRFEHFMFEKYTANYAQFDDRLKAVCDAAEAGAGETDLASNAPDEDEQARLRLAIASLDEPRKEMLYQDWVQRRQPPRPRTPHSLVTAAPQFFLTRAEQSVVCGNAQQRATALEFLELSGSPDAIRRLQHLLRWARARRIPDLPAQIEASLQQVQDQLTANRATSAAD